MKRCGYCGKESDDTALFCSGCGNALPGAEQPLPPVIFPTLTGGRATIVLGVYLTAQFVVGLLAAVIGVIVAGTQGKNLDPEQMSQVTEKAMPPAIVLGMLAAGAAVVLVSRPLIGDQLRDRTPEGAAWVPGSLKQIAQGAAIGMLIGGLYVAGALLIGRLGVHEETGPLGKMALTPGIPRIAWLVAALILAPPVEELLFRGILYGGYRRSFGATRAAVLTTLIFCLMHVTEVIHFLPGLVAIAGMALVTLWTRLRSAAIGPAVAVHFGYNAMIALTVLLTA